MSAARSNVRAFLGLVLLASMFAAVSILAQQPEPQRCLRSHRATAMQPLFAQGCAASACAGGRLDAARLHVVGFRAMYFEACDAWERDGDRR